MGKTFGQPPKGPKLGPVKNFKDLPPEKREALGDIDKIVSEPAPLDPRVVAAATAEPEPEQPTEHTGLLDDDTRQITEEEFAALQAVLNRAEPEEDPDEVALEQAAKPTAEDLRRFMRCLFGDTPYTKEYNLFGGMLIVEMTDVSPLVEDRIFMQLSLDQKMKVIETQDDWDIALDRYRMLANISKVIWAGQQIMEPSEETDLRKAVESRILAGIKNSAVYRALLRATRVFRRHLEVMLERAMDSDFWQVDGPSSQSEAT